MPTTRRRHAITETPRVQAALDELRRLRPGVRVDLGELLVLGARVKAEDLRANRDDVVVRRRRLADRIRGGEVLVDVAAAAEVRRRGWTEG